MSDKAAEKKEMNFLGARSKRLTANAHQRYVNLLFSKHIAAMPQPKTLEQRVADLERAIQRIEQWI